MNKLAATPTSAAPTDLQATEDFAVTSIREFLVFKLGQEEYGITHVDLARHRKIDDRR